MFTCFCHRNFIIKLFKHKLISKCHLCLNNSCDRNFFRLLIYRKPFKLSARKGLGELTIFLAFGPLLTLGTGFAISTDTISLFSNEFYNLIFLGVPVGLLTTNILFINQFPDYKSDKLAGRTIEGIIWKKICKMDLSNFSCINIYFYVLLC